MASGKKEVFEKFKKIEKSNVWSLTLIDSPETVEMHTESRMQL